MTRYRALPPDAALSVALDPLVALYDRRSGQTHLLAEPAPQLLDALSAGPLSLAQVHAALAERFDLAEAGEDGLAARLAELVEAGLIAAE